MLVSRLNSHPNVRADGELFSHLNQRSHTRVLRKAFSRQPFYVKAKGFKIFYYHPHDDRTGRVWQELARVEGLHVIHLRRRNILRTLVSRKLAGLEDVWSTTSPERGRAKQREDLAVSFSVEELRQGFRETREWELAGDDRFRDQPLIGVTYEDLVALPTETFRELTDFLGVPYRPPTTTLKKQNTRSLGQTVTNYGELKAAFAGSEWEEFFED